MGKTRTTQFLGASTYGLSMLIACSMAQGESAAPGNIEPMKQYGQPIELKGRHIYFTSWKYVMPGQVRWISKELPKLSKEQEVHGGPLQADSDMPAEFKPDYVPRGIRLVAQKAEKVPFGTNGLKGFAVIYDEGKYKVWTRVAPCLRPEPFSTKDKIHPGHDYHVGYAESKDGLNWDKPKLNLYEYDGNKENNVVFRGDVNGSIRGLHAASIFIDPTSKSERFKMFYLGIITEAEWAAFVAKHPNEVDSMARRRDIPPLALFGATSPDGIHWTNLQEPLAIQHADTENICYYDLDLKKYVAYVRTWQVNEKSSQFYKDWPDSWINAGRRAIGRTVSDDFRHFTKAETVYGTGADMMPSHVWYSNGKTTLPDAPDNHVMFPWRWEIETDCGDTFLLSSPDGFDWSQVPGGAVVERGPLGAPDGALLSVSPNLLEYAGDKWGIPYSANPIPHKYPGRNVALRKGLFPGVDAVQGLAMWPKGRLVALQCDEEGEFSTVNLVPPARRIRLNAIIEPTGYITVTTSSGHKEPSDRLIGDSLAMPVTWNSDPDLKNGGSPISLQFKMKQAKLFAVEFY